jgi:hypothetical protein
MAGDHSEAWRKRHALQIAAQLPDNVFDAEAILDYARELLDSFMRDRERTAPQRTLRALPGGLTTSPSLTPISNDKPS